MTNVPHLVDLADEAATQALGAALAALLERGDLLLLRGDLGAGKTTLARALIKAKLATHGLDDDVPSPTFTLVQSYDTPDLLLTHVDLYRIDDPDELEELGLGEALDDGTVLVEWPQKAEAVLQALSPDRLDISLSLVPEGARRASLRGHGAWVARLERLGAL
ncbi:MAG: tRNA (adenosine(37)-N6)-threonylcarbamoyltransferase complex ATPase subunit type 1 TsaE [Rhizobiales bacterium]|nr:tRNA (adenosine(37)-N6)-threonylcarbamoyltransferase complex ATPase subunit type 1 TsaE [Hyphomicrobiales bacterium]